MVFKLVSAARVLLMGAFCISTNLALRIDIQPAIYTVQSKGPVNISCFPEGQIKDIYLIEIKRNDDKPLVFLRSTSGISFDNDTFQSSQLQADGVIDTNISKTYLRLTLTQPTNDLEGRYTCLMFFSDEAGLLVERRASSNLTVEDFDVQGCLDEISSLKNEVKALKTNESKLKDRVETLEEENSILAGSTVVSFSASLDQDLEPSVGDVINYPDVMTNHGGGYNSTTGVFTAPVAGVYGFLVIGSNLCGECSTRLSIEVNGNHLDSFYITSSNGRGQVSSSSMTVLHKGDEVKVILQSSSSDATLHGDYLSNMFSGYLIKAS